jgi:hypothetical protein
MGRVPSAVGCRIAIFDIPKLPPRLGLSRTVANVNFDLAHDHKRMWDGVRYRSPDQTREPHPEHLDGHGQLPQSCDRAGLHKEA